MTLDLKTRQTPRASVQATEKGFRLSIPDGGDRNYHVAQLDDYAKSARKDFPHRPSLSLNLRARASAESIPGTWGFGLWNDPFGLSIGFGGNPLRFPALPNAVWFFHASRENYLSFSSKPGNGFLAQVFRSPVFPLGRLTRLGMTFLFSRLKARHQMSNIVEEDGVRLSTDVTEWHAYRFEWSPTQSVFRVDDKVVLETSVSPSPPLGLVIWIDNQYAAWRPDGEIGFGVLENTEPAWLEIENLDLD
jgi:ligand-binding SRPBCC domain-containing protein